MARTPVQNDNFNRSSLGTSNWAQLNTAAAGDITIYSSTVFGNQYGLQATEQRGAARWIGAGSFSSDQYSEITLVSIINVNVDSSLGVIVRASADTGTGRDYYEAVVVANGASGANHTTHLCKYANGTRYVLNSAQQVWANGDKLSIEAEGSVIRLCRNGTPLGGSWTVTDDGSSYGGAVLSGGQPGVTASSASGAGLIEGDDWEGGNLSSGTPATSLPPPRAFPRPILNF